MDYHDLKSEIIKVNHINQLNKSSDNEQEKLESGYEEPGGSIEV